MLTCKRGIVSPMNTEKSGQNSWVNEGTSAYNQFYCITECCIDQTAEGFTQSVGDFFRGEGEDGCEGNDGEEVQRKNGGGAPVALAGDDAERHEDEEDVDPC